MELRRHERNICQAAQLRANESFVSLLAMSEYEISEKVILKPPVASVKHCSINLLQERCSDLPEVCPDRLTFYLGTDRERKHGNERMVRNRRCPRWRPATVHSYSRSTCYINMEVDYYEDIVRPAGYFRTDHFLHTSMSRKKYLKTKDWIMIQRVEKKACLKEATLHYHHRGQPEVIFCVRDLLTVMYVEDISCQHFLQMNREEALENGYSIELLFSSHGPLVRNDKHLQGRSLLYFCCIKHQQVTTRKFIRVLRKDGSERDGGNERSGHNATMGNSGERENVSLLFDSPELVKGNPESFGTTSELSPNEASFLPSQSDSGANVKPHKRLLNALRRSEQSSKASSSSSIRTMSPSRSQKSDRRSLSSPIFETVVESDLVQSETGVKSPSPSPTCQSDINESESDKGKLEKKRRQSAPPKLLRRRSHRVSDANAIRSTYRIKKRKASTISVTIDDNDFESEFLLHHSLQDLYTWMRQQLLYSELLSPGSDFLLSSKKDSVHFPLKPNTATRVLSSLQCTSFVCQIFSKQSAESGLRGAASKYDTRFSLPLDGRQLEGLTPAQYLNRYCVVSNTWRAFYKRVFKSYDKMNKKTLSYKEISAAMEKLFVEFAPALLEKVTELMGFDTLNNEQTDWRTRFSIGPDDFVSVCCLANRILCQEDIVGGFHAHTIKQNDTHLEDADFFNIEGKLRDYNLKPLTRNLLVYIRNRPKS